MNRRQKIIISITGITLVSLFLIALTYGYYVTKIKGNTKDTSINLITDNLELVYGDDDGSIIGDGQLITPDITFEPKTFSVENKGKSTVEYSVILDNVVITDLSTGKKSTDENSNVGFESNDFVYTLTCTSGCNGVSTETTLPLYNNGILVSNSIDEGEKQTYSITITYKDTHKDQSADMNKSLEARINITFVNTKTLASAIIDNAKNVSSENKEKGYAEFRETPLTTPAEQISSEIESELTIADDDYGTSYYYRGNVKNNYVEFNDMCFRIVRIEGDESVKIILAAQKKCSEITDSDTGTAFIGTGNYGYTYDYVTNSSGKTSSSKKYVLDYLNGQTNTESSIKTKLDVWLENSELDKTKLKLDEWCLGNLTDFSSNITSTRNDLIYSSSIIYYKTYMRLSGQGLMGYVSTNLKCNEKNDLIYSSYIGTLTADEASNAGYTLNSYNTNCYLGANSTSGSWWTLSPSYFESDIDSDFAFSCASSLSHIGAINNNYYLRPALTLKAGTKISDGDGTITNPYVVE